MVSRSGVSGLIRVKRLVGEDDSSHLSQGETGLPERARTY